MARFLAVCKAPGLNEAALKKVFPGERTSEWRIDARTTVVKVYASYPAGTLVVEFDGEKEEHFTTWLKKVGWDASSIVQVSHIKAGPNLWKM